MGASASKESRDTLDDLGERADPPAPPGAKAFDVFEVPDGFGVSWLEPGEAEGQHVFRFARWNGKAWSEPVTVTSGDDFFANWADLPSVVRTGPDRYLAHWLKKSGEPTYAYDVELARSTNGGRSWKPLSSPHTDDTKTEHGFVSLVPGEHTTMVVWLDGRRTADDGPMTLRATSVDERTSVAAAEPGGPIEQPSELLDERVCECCATDAVRTGGDVLVTYRDRTDDEVRDIATVRRSDGEWSDPAPLGDEGWTIDGCPVNGPALAADGTTVAAVWFTKADDTPRVRAAVSTDAGRSFSEPVDLARPTKDRTPLGRVDVTVVDDTAVASWLTGGFEGDRNARVTLRRIAADEEADADDDVTTGPPVDVAATSADRNSGFPKLADTGDRLALVWSGAEAPRSLNAKLVSADEIPAVDGTPTDGTTAETGDESVADPMPELQAERLAGGESMQLAPSDEYTLVNLWATWCRPCRKELPVLQTVADRWSSDELRMIGLTPEAASEEETLRAFVEDRPMPFDVWYAPDSRPLPTFGADALPATFVYDTEGALVWSHDGAMTDQQVDSLAAKLEATP